MYTTVLFIYVRIYCWRARRLLASRRLSAFEDMQDGDIGKALKRMNKESSRDAGSSSGTSTTTSGGGVTETTTSSSATESAPAASVDAPDS
jgi:hypothetical protein